MWTAAIFAAVAAAFIAPMTMPAAAQPPDAGGDPAQVGSQIGSQIGSQLGSQIGSQVASQVASQLASQVDHGKTTYAQKCSHCHGPNMVNSGTITPDLRAFPDDRTRFVTTVKQGKNGRMPPWGDILTDDEIADVWAYISSRRTP
jgi:mono/diheme cytochrome c family protein